jgi:hypothetical protein
MIYKYKWVKEKLKKLWLVMIKQYNRNKRNEKDKEVDKRKPK